VQVIYDPSQIHVWQIIEEFLASPFRMIHAKEKIDKCPDIGSANIRSTILFYANAEPAEIAEALSRTELTR